MTMTREEILAEASRHCDYTWQCIVRIRNGDTSAFDDGDTYLGHVKAFGPAGMYDVVMQLLQATIGISWDTIRSTPLTLLCTCVVIPGHMSPDFETRRIPNPLCARHGVPT